MSILVIIVIFILFAIKSYFRLDPDFGWHIKMGEFILNSGIPLTDPFSYTMPSYPFVDHEWLTNILVFLGYKNIGWVGLGIAFSLITVLSLLTAFKFDFKKKYFTLPFILSAGVLLGFIGIRPQVISWLFFAVLVFIFLAKNYSQKVKFFIPPFFLIWANLHGGFILGLFIFLIFIFTNFYSQKRTNFTILIIFILSCVITLLNPYGINLHKEILISIFDSSLRFSIYEWMPAIFSYSPIVWIYVSISIALFYKYRASFTLFEKATYIFLFISGISSVRNLPLWAIFASFVLFKSSLLFENDIMRFKFGLERLNKAYYFLVVFSFFALIFPIIIDLPGLSAINESNFYPDKAVNYLKKSPSQGQVLSEYGWGGYLIWKYPEKKTFIDGRMPSWRRSRSPKGESNYAFKEYKALMNGDVSLKTEAEKYNIDTILLPSFKEEKLNPIAKILDKLELKLEKEGKYGNIYKQVKKEGWKLVYEDQTSVIYRN